MNHEESIVAELIRDAFRGVTLGDGVGLLQGQGLDDYADEATLAAYRAKDEKEDWNRIPVEMLESCDSSLCFLDAAGMRFHLPAFMLADLEGTGTRYIIFSLTHLDDYGQAKFATLNTAQREAVRQFLLLQLIDPDNEFHAPRIQAALDGYWRT